LTWIPVKISELTVASSRCGDRQGTLLQHGRPGHGRADLGPERFEIEDLFRVIKKLRDQGKGIVYISHRMDELKVICDSVTVMRDGRYIDTNPMSEMTTEKIISRMVGREIYETAHIHGDAEKEEVVLEVKGLNSGKKIRDVSFKLHKGEILGFAGLLGAGRTETARAIFGADPIDSGEIWVKGEKVSIKHPRDAVKYGIGYLSEDRKQYGLALGLSVETNTVMASLEKFTGALASWTTRRPGRPPSATSTAADQDAEHRPEDPQPVRRQPAEGGHRQVAGADCDILIFDEPTRGIDVGAKSEIYKLLNELADQGKSIIMISSELRRSCA
jgi:ribose transport system ATP-binding protein